MTVTNPFHSTLRHIERYAYKKGAFKGTAPLDPSRRARSHERLRVVSPTATALRFHNTDCVVFHEDGRVVINCLGWASAPATRHAVNDALGRFVRPPQFVGWVHSERKHGLSQLFLGPYPYADGITVCPDGTLSNTGTLRARRVDRTATAELARDMQTSGFKDVFPVLHAAATVDMIPALLGSPRNVRDRVSDECHAEQWSGMVAWSKFEMNPYRWGQSSTFTELDRRAAWARLMKFLKTGLHETVPVTPATAG